MVWYLQRLDQIQPVKKVVMILDSMSFSTIRNLEDDLTWKVYCVESFY